MKKIAHSNPKTMGRVMFLTSFQNKHYSFATSLGNDFLKCIYNVVWQISAF